MLTIDTHAHWYPPEWVELIGREGETNGAQVSRNEQGRVLLAAPGVRLKPQWT